MKKIMGYLAILILFQSCSFGPKMGPSYHRPEVDSPVTWKYTEESLPTPLVAFEPGKWWEIFKDPILNNLENRAVEANYDLISAMKRVDQVRYQHKLSAQKFFPIVELNPTISRFRSPSRIIGGGLVTSGFTSENYSYVGDVSYELDIWGRLRRVYEESEARLEASRQDYETVLLTLTAEVATEYFQLRQYDQRITILEGTIQLRQEALTLVKNRVDKGLVSELDLARAETELAAAEKEILVVGQLRTKAQNGLAILCGFGVHEFEIKEQNTALLPPMIPNGLPSDLLERRPDLRSAEYELKALNAEIGQAWADFLPVPEFDLRGGFESPQSNLVFDSKSRTWDATAGISWPIFPMGSKKAIANEAKARYEEKAAQYQQKFLLAVSEVENSLHDINSLGEQAVVHERLLKAARLTADISASRYKQGVDDYLVVVDAERQRLQAEQEAAQILSDRLISLVSLIKALGGSWDTD